MNLILKNNLEKIFAERFNNKIQKKIHVVLGIGGHAGAAWAETFTKVKDANHIVIFNSFDDGGSTRTVSELTGTQRAGDFRNTLEEIFLQTNNIELTEIFHHRVESKNIKNKSDLSEFEEIREKVLKFFKLYPIKISQEDILKDLSLYQNECLKKKNRRFRIKVDGSPTNHSIGNIILAVIMKRSGGFNEMVEELRSIKLLPSNFFPVCMSDDEITELVVIEEGKVKLRGESTIEAVKSEIDIKQLKVFRRGTDIKYSGKNHFIAEILKVADLINIPPTSQENFAQIEHTYYKEIQDLKENPDKKLLFWATTMKASNAKGTSALLEYFAGKYNNIKIIIPISPLHDALEVEEHTMEVIRILNDYKKEGKITQFFGDFIINESNLDIILLANCIDIVYNHPSSNLINKSITAVESPRGLKHNSEFIRRFVEEVINDKFVTQKLLIDIDNKVKTGFRRIKSID